jgi:hypothetical protein
MKREWRAFFALSLLTSVLVTACGEPPQVDEIASTTPTGVVLETMDAGGYTYAHVALPDTEMWVAGPPTPLKAGDTVSLVDTMAMGAFTSKALDRSFDEIIFVMSFRDTAESAPPPFAAAWGTAIQVVNTGGYTYVEVEVEDGSFWLAGPETEITEGTRVQWKGPMLMRDFHSPSLDRTFSEIVFVDNIWMTDETEVGASPGSRGD